MLNDVTLENVTKAVEQYLTDLKTEVKFGFTALTPKDGHHAQEVGIYTDREIALPIRFLQNGSPWTWRAEVEKHKLANCQEYVKFIIDILNHRALKLPKVELPNREDILKGYTSDKLTKLCIEATEDEYVRYVSYLIVTRQTCPCCGIGIMQCDVNAWQEVHNCHHCDYVNVVS